MKLDARKRCYSVGEAVYYGDGRMTERPRCCAGSKCSEYEDAAGKNGKRKRRGGRLRAGLAHPTVCGQAVCCEGCLITHCASCQVNSRDPCVAKLTCSVASLSCNWRCQSDGDKGIQENDDRANGSCDDHHAGTGRHVTVWRSVIGWKLLMIEPGICTLQVCKECIEKGVEEEEVAQGDSDSEGDAEVAVQQIS